MKTLLAAASALLFSTAIVAPAQAATITYTLTGTFSGINGGPFTDVDAVFTAIGDTDDAYDISGGTTTVVPLSSFSAVAGGLTYTFTTPISFFVNRSANFAGFNASDLSTGFLRFLGTSPAALTSYDGVSDLPATAVTFYTDGNTGTYNTDRGDVLVTSGTNMVLSASAAGVVPEPATWAMMIGGMGLAGGALRRRKANVSVRYA